MTRRKPKPYQPTTRIEAGTATFNLWMRHYRSSRQAALAKYWEERGYAYVPANTPPPELARRAPITSRMTGEQDR